MHLVSSALLLGTRVIQAVLGRVGSNESHSTLYNAAISGFIEKEIPVAQEKLLCNIGADGCQAFGAAPGVVVASPSKQDPPYFYTWTRDSALVFKGIIESFVVSHNETLQRHIMEYIAAQAHLQGVSNPSGSLNDGLGLAEPKFHVNETAFQKAWGRPQRDGPALRASTLLGYGWWLIENGYKATAVDILWPIIRNDLNYVAQYWNQTGFDLWEEVEGSSFFTVAAQYRALEEGSYFSAIIEQRDGYYSPIAQSILCFMQSFWVPEKEYIDANINADDGRTGLDANSILASIHLFDLSNASPLSNEHTFQPWTDRALANLKAVVDSFRIYGINKNILIGKAIAVGRYSEDVYFGGNPWYLNTLAVAEQLYDAILAWQKQQVITVSTTSLGFFAELVPGTKVGSYDNRTEAFAQMLEAVGAYADGFVEIVAQYTPSDGSLDEQFSRTNGEPLSAEDLTWSYAAFLSMSARRSGVAPRPWRRSTQHPISFPCDRRSRVGAYLTATSTVFPPSQTPKPTTTTLHPPSSTPGCTIVSSITLTFQVYAVTRLGQSLRLVGSSEPLGSWNPVAGVRLSADKYTSDNPVWTASVVLKAGQEFEYKYVNVEADGSMVWESGPNRDYEIFESCEPAAFQLDIWRV